jgi:predicted MPP superfamily phosphohydrolase
MPFLFIISLILFCLSIFSAALYQKLDITGLIVATVYLILLSGSITLLFKQFRHRHNSSNYKRGFYAFGAVISLFVPMLFFLVPGVIYLLSNSTPVFYVAITLYSLSFMAILYGILHGRWNWKTHEHTLVFDNLPEEMNGTTIVQISDVHVGSFFNLYHKVKPALDKISDLHADYIVFTGDLVNNVAEEMNGWEEHFRALKAKKGKFSILGNHDYGDYIPWKNEDEKNNNLKALVQKHIDIGFNPLLNQSVELGNNFYLLGVENWGTGGFRKSGKLEETLENVPENAFKLLLSHDPSHFDEQVVGTGIDLTLSGHTHGMQFGIERFGIKWSPVSFRYKKWAGLYKVGKQLLYVNRGFGYLGFPGRVGIYPEITLFTLVSKQ